jgi:glycine betaine/proline transport system permease protein
MPDDPFGSFHLPFAEFAQAVIGRSAEELRPLAMLLKWPFAQMLDLLIAGISAAPVSLVLVATGLLVWRFGGRALAIQAVATMLFLGVIGIWNETILTLSIIAVSIFFCAVIGIPSGILAAKRARFSKLLRPVLDAMQTTPAFVYLIPIAMIVGTGNVPGVIATMIFALPPIIRLTELGLRQIDRSTIEGAQSLGLRPSQILFLVEIPLASQSIRVGLNQTIMMALAMCVIASMIGVEGLGLLVLRGVGSLDIGLATQGGVGIVLIGILLDRLTQAASAGAGRRRAQPENLLYSVGTLLRAMVWSRRRSARANGAAVLEARKKI